MQAMPVLEALLNRKEVIAAPFAWNPHDLKETVVFGDVEDMAADSLLVRSDEAAEIYWNDTQDRLDPLKDFGPLRLPGGSVWVEYKWPERGYAKGEGWTDFPKNMWGAVFLVETPRDDGLFDIEATQYSFALDGAYVAHMNVGEKLVVDKYGYAVGEDVCWTSPYHATAAHTAAVRQEYGDDRLKSLGHSSRIGFIAVGLMNCKNVTTTETDKGGPRRRKSRGKKNPRMIYRTINIPGRNTQTEGDGTPAEKAEYALHRVRGHFKTYTAERPLMGQHVGTYWWGWQARGKAKNGVSVTDYKVGTGA